MPYSPVLTPEVRREIEDIVTEQLQRASPTREEFTELTQVVKELAEAQRRTEERLNQLAEAQRRTEEQVRHLAEEMTSLARDHKALRRTVAGISDTVGYTLENQAMKSLPGLLRRDYGLELEGRLVRRYVKYATGKHDEVNIYGWGDREGRRVLVLGESKVRLSKREVDRFKRLVGRVKEAEGAEDVLPVVVVHTVVPDVEGYARGQGIALYWSYEL